MIAFRHEMSKIIKLMSNGCYSDEAVRISASILKDGKIIAVPTDTVYGIAALTQCDAAVRAMYKVKRRDCHKPIAICVGSIDDIPKWGKISFPKNILDDLLPGPVTVVMERQASLNPKINPSVPLVGIRIPKCKFIQDLASLCSEPLALTSANISSMSSTLSVEEFKEIWPFLDLVIDGGVLGQHDPIRLGSTVVDLSMNGFFKVIRNGCSLERTVEILKRYNLQEL